MLPHELDNKALCLSLASTVCPACGGQKRPKQTFCGGEYRSLPMPLRSALYRKMGQGYREAVIEALKFLSANEVHMPNTPPPNGGLQMAA